MWYNVILTCPSVDRHKVLTSEHWREGRRVVELGMLADGLRGGVKCGLPLQLSHTS